jgi:hypothetical protein
VFSALTSRELHKHTHKKRQKIKVFELLKAGQQKTLTVKRKRGEIKKCKKFIRPERIYPFSIGYNPFYILKNARNKSQEMQAISEVLVPISRHKRAFLGSLHKIC